MDWTAGMSKRRTKSIYLTESKTSRRKCPSCGWILDAATSLGKKGATPAYESISLCSYCGGINIFDVGLMLRAASLEEIEEFKRDPGWGAVEALIAAIKDGRIGAR